MTTDCGACKHFYQEWDTNYSECKKEKSETITDEMWEGKINCPFFEQQEDEEQ